MAAPRRPGAGGARASRREPARRVLSLWSPGRGPEQMPETELLRTCRIAWLKPGATVPFTVAWRGPAAPTRIEFDDGWVPIP